MRFPFLKIGSVLATAALVTLLSVGVLGVAAGAAAESGLSLTPHPRARVVYHSDLESDNYMLTLGALEKVDGAWRAEKEHRLKGSLHRDTLEFPRDYSAREAFQYFDDQLQNLSSRELYRCNARRCGSSNSWANNRFEIKQLYGLDQDQYYGAYEVEGPRHELYFVALYAVRRGNKRVYAQVDILTVGNQAQGQIAPSPESIAGQLKRRGFYVLPGLSFGAEGPQLDAQHLQVLVRALKRERRLNIAIVGHDYGPGDIEQRKTVSLAYAEYVKTQLVAAGIKVARLSAFGVGSLAPERRGNRSQRVELVSID